MEPQAESSEFQPSWIEIDKLYQIDGRPEVVCDALIERQAVECGADLSTPCREAVELLDQWQADNEVDVDEGGDKIDWYRAWNHAAGGKTGEVIAFRTSTVPGNSGSCESNGPHPAFDPDATHWNDAQLTGVPCIAWCEHLDREIACTFGLVQSEKAKSNTRDNAWRPTSMSVASFIEGNAAKRGRAPWGLSRHIEDAHKGGAGIVLGACQTYRKANAVTTIEGIGLDFDTGHLTFSEAVENAQEYGFAFVAYTSFNHLTTATELNFEAVVKHHKCNGEPSLEEIKTYLMERKGVAPHIVETVEVEAMREHTDHGLIIRLRHKPIHKFRMVFLFKSTVVISELANTLSEAHDFHRRKVLGLAEKIGAPTDPATLDVSRFFYSARHRGGTEHHVVIHRAPPIDYAGIPLANSPKKSPRSSKKHEDVITQCGFNVSKNRELYGKRQRLADLMEDSPVYIGQGNTDGKVVIRCPFHDEHTNQDEDTATIAWNPDAHPHGFGSITCQHTCKDRYSPSDYIAKLIDDGDLAPHLLEDPEFMDPIPDQGEEKYLRYTPEEVQGEAEARAYLRKNLTTLGGQKVIADGAVEQAVQLLVDMGVPLQTALTRVAEAVADVERQLEGLQADKNRDPVAEAKAEVDGEIDLPSVLEPTFDERLVDANGFIYEPNDKPKLYREYGIKPNDERAFEKMQAEIRDQMYQNMAARFDYVVLDNDAKLAIAQPQGVRPKLWSERTPERLYRNRTAKYWGGTAKNPKVIEIKPGEVFLSARERSTFLDTCFEPDPKRAALAAQRGAFNLWNGFAVTGKAGDWSKLRDHAFHVLCSGNQDYFDWFMTKQASLFSRPGVKVPSSVAIFGEQGTGKSKFYDWLRRGIGSAALKVSSGRHLTGNFNAHLDGIILLVCEEAFWGGNKADGGIIKDIVGSETLQIEGKFQNVVERPNYVNIDFISNNKWIVPVDGEDARRFFVLECSNAHKQDAAYFGAIDDQMENGGLQAMVHELMHWDPSCIGGWEMLRYPPITDCLRQQAGMGLRGPAERLVVVLEDCILQGRTADGDAFYYELQEDIETPTARNHVVSALSGGEGRGNLSQEMKDALETFLGPDADKGDNNKSVIEYLGETRFEHDAEGKPIGEKRAEKVTNGRVRQVVFPPMKDIRSTLRKYGRG